MIEQEKQTDFCSCNNCGGYNMQPIGCGIKFAECGEIYQYILSYGSGGIAVRLCNKCANELKQLLEKQLGESK